VYFVGLILLVMYVKVQINILQDGGLAEEARHRDYLNYCTLLSDIRNATM
jgi:hypothetical protein